MRYRFSDYTLDTEAHVLLHDGMDQRVEPQVFDLLALLLKNAGSLVTKDQMVDEIWDGRIVSESAISARIAAARKAVGDDGKRQAVIRTVARRGLQFVAQLTEEDNGQAQPARGTAQPRVRYATAEDGFKLAFAVSGEGPPLLRVAHHPTHLELEWTESTERALFDALGERYTLIRMDQRGCGLSDLDTDDFSAQRSAKDMKVVLDTLGIDRCAIYGSSSGAMIAVEFAALFPDAVSHLITLGGYVDGRSVRDNADVPITDAIMTMAKEGWDKPDSAFMSGLLSVYFPTMDRDQLNRLARKLQDSCPVENEIRGRTFFNHHSVAGILDKVRVPTLVMHARGDAVHPLSVGQKYARGIPGAQLLVLESRNHYPLPEEPAWRDMIEAMHDFLAG
ncbi:MAG: alpha/beta hydrolase [Silicimonas sp.]|nr:alpha/beta hydrolase [Silicimonas sp.]